MRRKISAILLAILMITGAVFADGRGMNAAKNLKKVESTSFTEPIRVTVKKAVKNPEKTFKLLSTDNTSVDFIVNKLDEKNYVLIPLSPAVYTLKSDNNIVETSIYEGEVFVGSKENFSKIQKQFREPFSFWNYLNPLKNWDSRRYEAIAPEVLEDTAADGASSSKTNVQVDGVDEADVVKVVGDTIFYLRNGKISIAKTSAGKISIVGEIKLDQKIYLQDFYADSTRLVAVGSSYENNKTFTKALVYDITSLAKPKLVRTVMQEGYYSSSRKIGDQVYLISETYAYNFAMPLYKDTAVSEKFQNIDVASIRIFPPYLTQSIVTVSSFSAKDKSSVKHLNFMGSADTVYMTEQSLYISFYDYNRNYYPIPVDIAPRVATNDEPAVDVIEVTPSDLYLDKTKIKKFSVNKSEIQYVGEATIVGSLINQFAMDESNGIFRVAYTRTWESGSEVATFDKNMKPLGKLTGIAPQERIYSVRFMGDRLYLVTFEQVDPFFVIDMKNPRAPKILGELKIPGYSDYLHPYDANHVIGFGNATDVNEYGNVRADGMKIAMFDVSDVNNPKQISNVVIGTTGTGSELMYNHKALMYNVSKNYFGFPITVTQKSKNATSPWEVDYVFQGGYVYGVDKNFKLQFKGSATHRTGEWNWENTAYINRLVYVGDYIYFLSDKAISSNAAKDMSKVDYKEW